MVKKPATSPSSDESSDGVPARLPMPPPNPPMSPFRLCAMRLRRPSASRSSRFSDEPLPPPLLDVEPLLLTLPDRERDDGLAELRLDREELERLVVDDDALRDAEREWPDGGEDVLDRDADADPDRDSLATEPANAPAALVDSMPRWAPPACTGGASDASALPATCANTSGAVSRADCSSKLLSLREEAGAARKGLGM
jgi:hypothetical protein